MRRVQTQFGVVHRLDQVVIHEQLEARTNVDCLTARLMRRRFSGNRRQEQRIENENSCVLGEWHDSLQRDSGPEYYFRAVRFGGSGLPTAAEKRNATTEE